MAQIYRTVVGNNSPDLTFTCERNGTVIDLTAASSVKLALRQDWNNVTANTANQTCSIGSPATAGVVTYTPQAGDFPVEGRYLGDVKITYINSKVEHLYELLVIIARPAVS